MRRRGRLGVVDQPLSEPESELATQDTKAEPNVVAEAYQSDEGAEERCWPEGIRREGCCASSAARSSSVAGAVNGEVGSIVVAAC